jgi:MraZ protein
MDQFVSHHVPCPDAKGRVSVPASLRARLARYGVDGLYCHAFKTAPGARSAARPHGARE